MVLVVEVMGGVRYDPSTFPDGLFFIYGCESGLWLSNDLPTHLYDPVKGTFVHLTQGTKPWQDAEGEGGLSIDLSTSNRRSFRRK